MYDRLIEVGCRHGEALEKLAIKIGVDRDTVVRTLAMADRAPRGR
jgi:hypothetical protein